MEVNGQTKQRNSLTISLRLHLSPLNLVQIFITSQISHHIFIFILIETYFRYLLYFW